MSAIIPAHPSVIKGFTPEQLKTLAWLKKVSPTLFAMTMERAGIPAGSTLGELVTDPYMGATTSTTSSTSSLWSTIANAASGLGQAYLSYTSQQKLLNMQMQRASQGLPPLNAAQYSSPLAVQVGMSPTTAAQLGTKISTGMGSLMVPLALGGVVIVGAILLRKKK